MKKILLFASILCSLYGTSQDKIKLQRIDSLVNVINSSDLRSTIDSINQDQPQLGLKMKTFISTFFDSSGLRKFVNATVSTTYEGGKENSMSTSSAFYYYQDSLIKVNEFLNEEGKGFKGAEWYYYDDKPLYYTLKTEQAESRSKLLIQLSKTFQKQLGIKK